MNDNGNGDKAALTASRAAAVEQAAFYYQELSAKNDELASEVAHLKTELAGYKVTVEVLNARFNDAESRLATAMLTVEQHKAARIEYEALFAASLALYRTFKVPAAPLVRELQAGESDARSRNGAGDNFERD